jgi:amino acid transporter
MGVGASSPLTVLVGGIPSTYALTGVVGVPAAFLVVLVVVLILAVGHVAVSKHVTHPAPFYAQLARGFSPIVGVAGAAVALLGYNAIQISLYPLIGTTLVGMFGGTWWMWALGVAVIVAVLGQLRGAVLAAILGALLCLEIATILLFDIAAFTNPAAGAISTAPLTPTSLLGPGAAGAIAFTMAAFVGGETPGAYGEEARSHPILRSATLGGIVFIGGFSAVSAWAYATMAGPGQIVATAQDPDRGPLVLLGTVFGTGMTDLATLLLVTSVLAAMAAFHGVVARTVFAVAREKALPAAFGRVSSGVAGGAPLGASLVQSVVAVAVVIAFAVAGAQPMTTMFVWLSTIGAVCILLLLTVSSAAAAAFFRRGQGAAESIWVRVWLPNAGTVLGVIVTIFMLSSLGSLLGTAPGSGEPWLVAGLVTGVALAGLAWGAVLRDRRPEVYQQLGRGTPNEITVLDQRLAALEV